MSDEFDCVPGSNCCALCSTFSCNCRDYKMLAEVKRLREELAEVERERDDWMDKVFKSRPMYAQLHGDLQAAHSQIGTMREALHEIKQYSGKEEFDYGDFEIIDAIIDRTFASLAPAPADGKDK